MDFDRSRLNSKESDLLTKISKQEADLIDLVTKIGEIERNGSSCVELVAQKISLQQQMKEDTRLFCSITKRTP